MLAILSSLLLLLTATTPTLASTSSPHLVPRGDIELLQHPVPLNHDGLKTERRKKEKLRVHADKAHKQVSSTLSTDEGRLALPAGVKHKSIWSILFAAAAIEDSQMAEDDSEEEEVEDDFEEEGDGGDMLSMEEWSRRKRAVVIVYYQ
ncbi:hypothetical protein BJY59DRAFT_714267 [Rhodotorula toruloides]